VVYHHRHSSIAYILPWVARLRILITSSLASLRYLPTTTAVFSLAHLSTMGAGAFIEPLVVVTLLFGGTYVNRNTEYRLLGRHRVYRNSPRSGSPDSGRSSLSSSASLLANVDEEPKWRKRQVTILGMSKDVMSPNTKRFQDYFLSRLLKKFPFLVEAWYWALIYWVSIRPDKHTLWRVY